MARDLTAANIAQIDASTFAPVIMAKLEFTTPVYVHTEIGSLTFESNEYIGVGNLAGFSVIPESQDLRPAMLQLQLSGIVDSYVNEALNSANYGDKITLYLGFIDAGALVGSPDVLWRGKHQFMQVRQDETGNTAIVTAQHELASLDEIDGGRFSDEDQQSRFSGDTAFQYIHLMATQNLIWPGGVVQGGIRRPPIPEALP